MAEPQTLRWEIKTASRDYWHVTATWRSEEPSQTEEDYYETVWDVKITTSSCSPEYAAEFNVRTQYNEEITLPDIADEMHAHIMAFYRAAMVEWGVQFGRRHCVPIQEEVVDHAAE